MFHDQKVQLVDRFGIFAFKKIEQYHKNCNFNYFFLSKVNVFPMQALCFMMLYLVKEIKDPCDR